MGLKIEYKKLNKSVCDEMFGGDLEIDEEPDDVGKLQAKLHKEGMKKTSLKILNQCLSGLLSATGLPVQILVVSTFTLSSS